MFTKKSTSKIFIILFLVIVLPTQTIFASTDPDIHEKFKVQIGQDVIQAVAAGETRVIIDLQISPSEHSSGEENKKIAIANTENNVLNALAAKDFQVTHKYTNIPAIAGILTSDGLEKLMSNPNVRSISMDHPGGAHLAGSVTALGADIVHLNGYTGQGITVAVLDSGIDTDHPDLSDSISGQHCFISSSIYTKCAPANTTESANAEDENGHGTHVSGIITSNGSVSSIGFAPDADIVAVRVLDASGSGWVSDWMAGLDWIRTNQNVLDVDVINMSIGTFALFSGNCDAQSISMTNIISQLNSMGIVIFASTGNQGSSTQLSMPACMTGVIAVGATYDSDLGQEPDSGTYNSLFGGSWPSCSNATTNLQTITCFTNSNTAMDIVAPGAWITSSGLGGGTATYAGTSQASPTAAGIAALMLEMNSTLTPTMIETTLKNTGSGVVDPKNGLSFRLINALAAVNAVKPSSFNDVPFDNFAKEQIESIYSVGITGGCSSFPLNYCPDNSVTRDQMAVFLERGLHGSSFFPPNVIPTFNDTTGNFAEDWIEALKNDGITGGCGTNIYCPSQGVTRAQMAIFLERAMHGSSFTPPNVSPTFNDTAGNFAEDWIEALKNDGITSGCGADIYCPDAIVTRAQMAIFLVRAFGLP